jgi:hypothetical protein
VRRVARFQLAASSRAVIFAQVYCSLFFPGCFLVRGRSAVPVSVRRLSSSFVGSSRSGGCRYVPYHSVCGSRFGEDCCMWLSSVTGSKTQGFWVLIVLLWWVLSHVYKVFDEIC